MIPVYHVWATPPNGLVCAHVLGGKPLVPPQVPPQVPRSLRGVLCGELPGQPKASIAPKPKILLATRFWWRGFECREMPTLPESLPPHDRRVCKGMRVTLNV